MYESLAKTSGEDGTKLKEVVGKAMEILAGANVVMPNLSPVSVRDKYALYDGKICTGSESAECIKCLSARVACAGYEIVVDRGDHKSA